MSFGPIFGVSNFRCAKLSSNSIHKIGKAKLFFINILHHCTLNLNTKLNRMDIFICHIDWIGSRKIEKKSYMSDVVYNETSNTMFCKLFPQGGRGVEAWQ